MAAAVNLETAATFSPTESAESISASIRHDMTIVLKLLVMARLTSLVSGGKSTSRVFSGDPEAILASSPSALQVMNIWAIPVATLFAILTAPILSGLFPERAKEISSTFFPSGKNVL